MNNQITLTQWNELIETVTHSPVTQVQADDTLYIGSRNFGNSKRYFCYDNYDCPGQEYCENVTFQGTANTVGFCTRSCSAPGTTGGDCDTAGHGAGLCSADLSAQGPRCLLPCNDPADICPSGNLCTNLISGSTSDVSNGFCLPYQF